MTDQPLEAPPVWRRSLATLLGTRRAALGAAALVVFFWGFPLLLGVLYLTLSMLPLGACLYAYVYFARLARRQPLGGKTVLITGGGSGLGRRLARVLAEKHRCRIVLCDINEPALASVRGELETEFDVEVHTYRCNVGSLADTKALAERVHADVGDVDVLVNNAGIVSGKHVLELTEEHVRRTVDVNTLAHIWAAQAFLPRMMARGASGDGTIVNIVSAAGIQATSGLVDYCASKFGAFGANEALRLDVRAKGKRVHVLGVCPYYIGTGMFEGVKSPFPLLPILDELHVAESIVDAIECRDHILVMPWFVNVSFIIRLLPVRFSDFLNDRLGVGRSMSTFKGRGWQATSATPASAAAAAGGDNKSDKKDD
mmetsp:Transcript_40290/g.98885  ORF Transcript_40290/g.98885 Transcript_40290/m.98885 type:complete len:370 (+) Transcript_40290:70-1179(+)